MVGQPTTASSARSAASSETFSSTTLALHATSRQVPAARAWWRSAAGLVRLAVVRLDQRPDGGTEQVDVHPVARRGGGERADPARRSAPASAWDRKTTTRRSAMRPLIRENAAGVL